MMGNMHLFSQPEFWEAVRGAFVQAAWIGAMCSVLLTATIPVVDRWVDR